MKKNSIITAFCELKKGRWGWLWVIPHCPLCGKKHVHGGGGFDDDPRRYLDHRIPHCLKKPEGVDYELKDK